MDRHTQMLYRAVGENIDALLHIDLRGYAVPRILYQTARGVQEGPLSTVAAMYLAERLQPGDKVLFLTGFPFLPMGKAELDGLVGTCALARSVDIAFGVKPAIVTDPPALKAVQRLVQVAGLNPVEDFGAFFSYPHTTFVCSFTLDEAAAAPEAERLLAVLRPKAVIAVEKPGANERGVYHQGNGESVTHLVAKTDAVFEQARRAGIATVAIGDLGNEVGLGGLASVLKTRIPFGANCCCGCGGGITAALAADRIVTASVSDWGAYGLAAAIALVSGRLEALHDGALESRLLREAVEGGVIDGSGYAIPAVDGVGEVYNVRLVEQLRDVVEYPLRMKERYKVMYQLVAEMEDRLEVGS